MVSAFDYRAKGYKTGRGRSAEWVAYPFGMSEKGIRPQWYIPQERLPNKLEGRERQYRIGFCDVASPTNERSLEAALIPPGVVCGHKVPTLTFQPTGAVYMMVWLAVANSFVIDFVVRKKVSLQMSFTIMDSLPFPRSVADLQGGLGLARRALTLSCAGPEMTAFPEVYAREDPDHGFDAKQANDPDTRVLLQAEINAMVARDVYGLTRDELRFVLDPAQIEGAECPLETFRVLRDRELREYGEFRTRRLILEAWDRLS